MGNNCKLIVLCVVLFGCTQSERNNGLDFNNKFVEEADLLIDPNVDENITFPSFVRTNSDYFLLYDGQLGKIFKYSYEGKKLNSFGSQGRGPGEFQSITNYWILDDGVLFYDFNAAKLVYYDLHGTFIKEKLIKAEYLSIGNARLYNNKFVLPANGEEGALLKVVDYQTNEIDFIGIGYDNSGSLDDNSIRDEIRRTNRVPEFMYNQVTLDAVGSDIYSFQNVTGTLQKYTVDCGLVWEINTKIPAQEILFDKYQEELFSQDQYVPSLSYTDGVHATDEGIAVLLNVPESEPTSIAWIPKNGKSITIVEYPNIKTPSDFLLRFRIAPEIGSVIFVNSIEGEIFRSDWPF